MGPSKGFDEPAPISALAPAATTPTRPPGASPSRLTASRAKTAISTSRFWNVAEVISALSHAITLLPGDIILTGTPAGVGPVERGETVVGSIDGVGTLGFFVA